MPKPTRNDYLKKINQCTNRIDLSINNIDISNIDLDMSIVKDISNPTKEEVIKQLSALPSIMAYYSNIKIYAQLMLEIAEQDLYQKQLQIRQNYKQLYLEKINSFNDTASKQLESALNKNLDTQFLKELKTTLNLTKPKEPKEKDIDSFIKLETLELEQTIINYRFRLNKIKEFCKALDQKFVATKALEYSLEKDNSVNALTK